MKLSLTYMIYLVFTWFPLQGQEYIPDIDLITVEPTTLIEEVIIEEGSGLSIITMLFAGFGLFVLTVTGIHYYLIYRYRKTQPYKTVSWVVIVGSFLFPFYSFIIGPFIYGIITAFFIPGSSFDGMWGIIFWLLILPFACMIHLFFAFLADLIFKKIILRNQIK